MRHNLTGRQFGELEALEPTDKRVDGRIVWRCRCKCGKETFVASHNLVTGNTKSCGCLSRQNLQAGYVDGTFVHALNSTIPADNSSGVRGVHFVKLRGKWQSYINFKGKRYNLGTYSNFDDAVAARKAAESAVWGDFLEWYKNYKNSGCEAE